MPRRDHQALLINKDSQLLIYGGKNDNAFSYTVDNLDSDKIDTDRIHNAIYDEIKSTSLDDIMIYDLETQVWTAVCQRGWRPEARWAQAVSYNEHTS